MDKLLTVIVSALVGGVVSYVGALIKTRLDIHRTIDNELREKRDVVYKMAWQLTGALPRRPRIASTVYLDLTNLTVSLSKWYYEIGGMYMSGGARRSYSEMMNVLEKVRMNGEENEQVNEKDYESARKVCSTFRSWLTQDLLSRRSAPYLVRKPHF